MSDRFDCIISADSHVIEPYEIYTGGLHNKFGDQSPRMLEEYGGKKGVFFFTGDQVMRIRKVDEEQRDKGVDPAVSFDPAKRLAFMDEAGVQAEVIYATLVSMVMHSANLPQNRPMVRAAVRIFNDWVAEYCSQDPNRLLGVAAVSTDDPQWAADEVLRIRKKGLRGIVINTLPPEGCPDYRHPDYDVLWATAEETDTPITLHIVTGRVRDFAHVHTKADNEAAPGWLFDLFSEVKTPLANDFIFGQIFDRFPKLKIVCSEFEVNWVPSFMWYLDMLEGAFAPRVELPTLERKASDYMRDRVWHGIVDDPFGDHAIPHVGASQVCWGSDFPHVRSIGTNAQAFVADLFKNFSREDQEMIVGGNTAGIYGLN